MKLSATKKSKVFSIYPVFFCVSASARQTGEHKSHQNVLSTLFGSSLSPFSVKLMAKWHTFLSPQSPRTNNNNNNIIFYLLPRNHRPSSFSQSLSLPCPSESELFLPAVLKEGGGVIICMQFVPEWFPLITFFSCFPCFPGVSPAPYFLPCFRRPHRN
jgi:hypothetical protein